MTGCTFRDTGYDCRFEGAADAVVMRVWRVRGLASDCGVPSQLTGGSLHLVRYASVHSGGSTTEVELASAMI